MGLIGPPNIAKLAANKDVQGLIKALSYKNEDHVRVSAAHALGEIGNPLAVEPLLECLWRDRSSAAAASSALGKIRDPRAIQPLVQLVNREMEDEPLLGSMSRKNIGAAISALGEFGVDGVDPLISLFPGAGKHRPKIINALLATNTNQAMAWLMHAYQEFVGEHQTIVNALGKSGDQRAVETLIMALKSPDYDLSRAAARALDLLHWKPDQREAGAHYWVGKGEWSQAVTYGPVAVKPLINVLFDDGNDSAGRQAAAKALGQIGLPSLDPLVEALSNVQFRPMPVARRLGMGSVWHHPDMYPRTIGFCVEALVLMGKKSLEHLRAYLDHDSKYVNMVIAEAVEKIAKKNP